jgi:hypothetical protein
MERGTALKSIKIRKLGIEDLEQVLHIQEIINLSNFNLHPTGEGRFELSACNP